MVFEADVRAKREHMVLFVFVLNRGLFWPVFLENLRLLDLLFKLYAFRNHLETTMTQSGLWVRFD